MRASAISLVALARGAGSYSCFDCNLASLDGDTCPLDDSGAS